MGNPSGNISTLFLIFLIFLEVSAYNILFLTPISSHSHSNFFKPVVKELVDRGHFVTYWNGIKPELNGNNNTAFNFRPLYSPQLEMFSTDQQVEFQNRHKPFELFFDYYPRMLKVYCKALYSDPVFHRLMNVSNEHYDLIIVEGISNECVLPLVAMFDVPFVYMNGVAPMPWLLNAIGSPLASDHFPVQGFGFTDEMNFWQRTVNSLSSLGTVYFRKWFILPVVDRIVHKMLKSENLPKIEEIERRYLSLLIVNTHLSINYQLPTSPALIQAGGLHCVPPEPLPKDLETFVSGSGDAGFIIVSFGSVLRGVDIPKNFRRIFLSAFARLPQRVLWKLEEKPGKEDPIPSNVKLLRWMPQQDLLGHPKIRLFVTHGGLFSNQEAVYHGVPLVVLPIIFDQPINAQKAHDDGYAIRLDWDGLTEDILYDAIQLILTNPKYKENMEKVSALARDQLESPLHRAVYWIEYVIRHRGAPHLRTAANKLMFFQRSLLDIFLFVSFSTAFFCFLLFRLFRCLCSGGRVRVTDPKKTN